MKIERFGILKICVFIAFSYYIYTKKLSNQHKLEGTVLSPKNTNIQDVSKIFRNIAGHAPNVKRKSICFVEIKENELYLTLFRSSLFCRSKGKEGRSFRDPPYLAKSLVLMVPSCSGGISKNQFLWENMIKIFQLILILYFLRKSIWKLN